MHSVSNSHFSRRSVRRCLRRRLGGFTLIEMLLVLVIIAIVAALALPHMRGNTESAAINAACHQLVEDLSLARQKAIAQRSTVAVVFVSPEVFNINLGSSLYTPKEKEAIRRLQGGVYTHYALFQFRKVGEQPGVYSGNYITEWKALPDKTFIDTNAFNGNLIPPTLFRNGVAFPFPFSDSPRFINTANPGVSALPYIAFDASGRCIRVDRKETGYGMVANDMEITGDINVARGSILFTRQPDNSVLAADYEVQEIPPFNATNNTVHIDFLTGRAKRVELELR